MGEERGRRAGQLGAMAGGGTLAGLGLSLVAGYLQRELGISEAEAYAALGAGGFVLGTVGGAIGGAAGVTAREMLESPDSRRFLSTFALRLLARLG